MNVLALFACLFVLFLFGFVALRAVSPCQDLFLTVGLPLPVGLTLALGICKILHDVLPFEKAWVLTGVIVTAGTLIGGGYLARAGRLFVRPPVPKLSKSQWTGLGIVFMLAYFFLHSQQMLYPENDYLTHFPLIGLLSRGVFPPPNPYYPEVVLHGHFGRDYMVAFLSRASGGDHIFIIWCFNHLLSLSSFLMAAGLGYRSKMRVAPFMVSVLLFFGVSVGSRVGLVDTFDNNNLLVYTLLLVFIALLTDDEGPSLKPTGHDVLLAILLGIYAIVYETHMILLLGVVGARPFLASWCERKAVSLRAFGRPLAICFVALGLGALMGGVLQDLALRAAHIEKDPAIDRFASYESQKVKFSFPKKKLLQVCMGTEEYNRISYVYGARVLHEIPPKLDKGGYTFVFSRRFLALHWLAMYLGLPAGLYLIRRRQFVGLIFWSFGLFAFLTPAVVDFGPVHELEYLRWEFAAGFGFAGALGISLAGAWQENEGRKWARALLAVLLLATSYGGVRRLNETIITIQKSSPSVVRKLATPLYSSGFDWLTRQKELELEPADLKAALWLRDRIGHDDRLLLPDEPRTNSELLPEATILGLTGTRAVGHQSPPVGLPVGTYPYFHTPNWTVFWQQFDPRALADLKADWIFLKDSARYPQLSQFPQLEKVYDQDNRAIYRVSCPNQEVELPEGVVISKIELPDPLELQSEVAYPVTLELKNESAQDVSWEGPIGLSLNPETDYLVSRPSVLWLRCKISLKSGQSETLPFWLVPPLAEGPYGLEFITPRGRGSRPIASPPEELAYSFKLNAKGLTLEAVRQLARDGEQVDVELSLRSETPGFRIKGPVYIGWRVWDAAEKRYGTPFGFDGIEQLDTDLTEPGLYKKKIRAKLPLDEERYQLHFFLLSRTRLEVPLPIGGR